MIPRRSGYETATIHPAVEKFPRILERLLALLVGDDWRECKLFAMNAVPEGRVPDHEGLRIHDHLGSVIDLITELIQGPEQPRCGEEVGVKLWQSTGADVRFRRELLRSQIGEVVTDHRRRDHPQAPAS